MLPGMRFYIVSIVSIFIALGIGIYIGFSIDSQELIFDQRENIINILESQFDVLGDENYKIREENQSLDLKNKLMDEYNRLTYYYIINSKLSGFNVGIIETNSDYIMSSIGKDLEEAGANVMNFTTLNKGIENRIDLDNILSIVVESIINGDTNNDFQNLKEEGIINYMGSYKEPIDYLVISGGSFEDPGERINKVDKQIIHISRKYDIPIIGVEKHKVNYSYIDSYMAFGITTIDNIDMIIGKVALILAMEGNPGNYGIKPTAKSLIPIATKTLNNY